MPAAIGGAVERNRSYGACAAQTCCIGRLIFAFDQVIHWAHIFPVAGETETAKIPSVLNGSEHRVMIGRIIGGAGVMNVVRINQGDDVSAARIGVAAATGIAKTERPGVGKVAFIPSDEDDGISAPGF